MTSVTPPDKPVTFHNSRMVVFGIAIFGLCAVLIALGMALESFSEFFLGHGKVFFKILGGLQWGLGSISIAAIGMAFWRLALRAGVQQVRLETAGVHFRRGTTKKPFEAFFCVGPDQRSHSPATTRQSIHYHLGQRQPTGELHGLRYISIQEASPPDRSPRQPAIRRAGGTG